MRKLITVILTIWSIVLFLVTIKQCTTSNVSEEVRVPDTIFMPSTKYIPLEPLPGKKEPDKVIIYQNSQSSAPPIDSTFSSCDGCTVDDSLSSFNLNQNKLRMDFLNRETKTSISKLYTLNTEEYQYTFSNGSLTTKKLKFYQKKDFVKPYVYVKYRPFNQLWDAGTGINFKTGNINYQIGINSFYYPRINQKGFDLEIGLRYNF